MARGGVSGRLGCGLLAAVVVAGCAATAQRVAVPAGRALLGWEQTGEASWYGEPYHGRRTSSGERYDMHRLTAAHPSLPFGTRVRVTNLDNGQAVEVRINDRGPFKRGRIVDVSYAAAQRLGSVGAGVIPVRLRVVGLPE
jgi:rare lipoprotein A